jgi:hypothetical protein
VLNDSIYTGVHSTKKKVGFSIVTLVVMDVFLFKPLSDGETYRDYLD